MAPAPLTWTIRLYQALTTVGAPLALRAARRRFEATGGPMARLPERAGRTAQPRPDGPLIWVHAVSVGESLSVMGLIEDMVRAGQSVLLTTTTATAAQLAAKRLPEGALHQFAPIDTPQATARFLDHWRPDLAVFIESEIWPNQILACETRGIPRVLLNARLSEKSLKNWGKRVRTAMALFTRFDRIMCQSDTTRTALIPLGAPPAHCSTTGDMKAAAPPLAFDAAEAALFTKNLGSRPLWVMSSTHPGEEEVASMAHGIITAQHPDALMILVPRHPERGNEVETLLQGQGWSVARRSQGTPITPATQIYLADTLGELGLWYHLAPMACVAGSFTPVGGHNPYEPAHFGCAVLHGPLYANFAMAYGAMAARHAAIEVEDATALGLTVAGLFDSARLPVLQEKARRFVEAATDIRAGILDTLLSLKN
ncbi:3-deoxy-D-manno-octulosonic acid transferase [Shimia sp. SDUM112013]|uniref:3-deoxy-D-manno-octulosonic acid transferase n=1 Tax=Shimia sp. SDUM112013 TaxID=3136160 RepID=UPI0032EE9338